MTIEDTKHWLKRAFYANKKIQVLDVLIKQCRERADGLSIKFEHNDKAKSDTRLNGTENAFMKLADVEYRYNEQKQELLRVSEEISDTIALLHDYELETVLIYRYLLFYTIEQTAEQLNYSISSIKLKHKIAIKNLCELIPPTSDNANL